MITIKIDCPQFRINETLAQEYDLTAEIKISDNATSYDCLEAFVKAMRIEGYHISKNTLKTFIEGYDI